MKQACPSIAKLIQTIKTMNRTKHRTTLLISIVIAVLASATGAHAQFLTGTKCRYDFVAEWGVLAGGAITVNSDPGTVEVPLNSEGTASYDLMDVDVYGEQAKIFIRGRKNAIFSPSPNKVRFSFQDLPIPAFKDVRLATPISWPGIDESRLTTGTNYVELDFGGLKGSANYLVVINVSNPRFVLPKLAVRVSQIELCWNAVPDAKYQLQYQEGPAGGMWTKIGAPVVATANSMCLNQPVVELPRFYRIVGLP
jgi:hypothetical protein